MSNTKPLLPDGRSTVTTINIAAITAAADIHMTLACGTEIASGDGGIHNSSFKDKSGIIRSAGV